MPATAIDIGSHSFKAIVAKLGKQPTITRVAETPNTSGISIPKDESQASKLAEILDQFFNDHKLPRTDVYLSLPEEVVATKVIYLPPLSDAELASAIDWQAEQHIPIPLNQLSLEYQVLYRPPKNQKDQPMRVLLVGTRRNVVELISQVFFTIGIQPKAMETQIFSIIRALGFEESDPTTLIVHIGAENTQLAVVEKTEIKIAANKKGGGTILTKAIQQAVSNITLQQAQEYKHSCGLDPQQLQGKIAQILLPTLEPITQEVVKLIRYYNNEQPQAPILRMVLTGGTAQLPRVVGYFTQATNLEVLLAAPFAGVQGEIPTSNHQPFIVCTGLIMRGE
ncbi:MAG TPA: type IV pilus assembly protein PilM [Candidatus Woesebacteria bacterium]|nr:type IV pilus assembly protein PilM [Candidatus Woesebacteria bacterium]